MFRCEELVCYDHLPNLDYNTTYVGAQPLSDVRMFFTAINMCKHILKGRISQQ